jgi:oligoendopeptidase F
MIDFEPPHMQTFFAYLRASWLLSLCLCGIDMCMSDRRDSEFVREAVTRLETLINNPKEKESEEVIMILEDYMPRSELLDFLKNTLNALKGDDFSREQYQAIYQRLLQLLDSIKQRYGELERAVLSRYRAKLPTPLSFSTPWLQ